MNGGSESGHCHGHKNEAGTFVPAPRSGSIRAGNPSPAFHAVLNPCRMKRYLTSIRLGMLFALLGSVRVSTPSLKLAPMFSTSMALPRVKERT